MKRSRGSDRLAGLFLLGGTLLFFADVLWLGRVLLPLDNLVLYEPWRSALPPTVPQNSLLSDALLQNLVWRELARRALQAGDWPLWNPWIVTGMPFLATGQPGLLYPPSLLFLVLPVLSAYGWYAALHVFLTALGYYCFLRAQGVGLAAALVGGLTGGFGQYLLTALIWPMVVGSVTWLPWLLLVTQRLVARAALERARPADWLLVAATAGLLGLVLLAGHLEYAFYTLLVAAVFGLGESLAVVRAGGPARLLAVGWRLGLAALLGVGLSLGQLWPFLEVVRASARQGLVTYGEVRGFALPLWQGLTFLLPDFFGNPSHHGVRDFWTGQWQPVQTNRFGQPTDPPQTIFWGAKNYIEAAGYVGLVPLLVLPLALGHRQRRLVLTAVGLAVVSLLFAFGTPLYALLYYGLPFVDQLRTPFRWLYPYSASLAILAGLGLAAAPYRRLTRGVGVLALAAGLGLAAGLLVIRLWPDLVLGLPERLIPSTHRLWATFADGRQFLSYELPQVARLSGLLLGAGLGLLLVGRGRPVGGALLVGVVALDLWSASYGFNSRTTPDWLARETPVQRWLAAPSPAWRLVSFGPTDVLMPNLAALWGWRDVRGYDSTIPRDYVEYWRQIEEPRGLRYNLIHKLEEPASLTSPFLDLLAVRYVLTTVPLPEGPALRRVYQGEILVYERPTARPRAFIARTAEWVPDRAMAFARLRQPGFPLAERVLLEGRPPADLADGGRGEAVFLDDGFARLRLQVRTDGPAWLVLLDAFAPGWEALVDGRPVPLYRAYGQFRAVPVPAGTHEVIFRYQPASLRLGLLGSLLAGLGLLLLAGVAGWQRVFGPAPASLPAVVARNSLVPLVTSLLNRGLDMAFAMVALRLLGPENIGRYAFAVNLAGYLEILTNFGLNALVIREVARQPAAASRYLAASWTLRWLLWLGVVPPVLGGLALWQAWQGLSAEAVWATGLLALALVPGNVAAALSSLFYARERLEYPALLTVLTTVVKVGLGAVVLLAGGGIVGLAAVAIVGNIVTAGGLFLWARRLFALNPRPGWEPSLLRGLIPESFPLMLNHLLATVFFRIDILLLQPLRGDREVGFYSAAYRYIDGLGLIPSTFTFALFPHLARAAAAGEGLSRAYLLGARLLVVLAFPLAFGVSRLADPLVLLLGGAAYLPEAGQALRVLIWFLPLSYLNGLTQYVLIAAGRQRAITRAFLMAAAFNILANLIVIPRWGYLGAAVVTVLSEAVLLVPFQRALGGIVDGRTLWRALRRPVVAALGAALPFFGLSAWPLLGLVVGLGVYGACLLAPGGLWPEERALLARLVQRLGGRWPVPGRAV